MRSVLLGMASLGLAVMCGAQSLDSTRLDRALGDGSHAAAARAFYAEREHRPLWILPERAGLSPAGRQLVEALGRADEDGLAAGAYLGPSSADPAQREAALTHAFLTFCEHLMRGRVDPRSVHRDWRASRRTLDAEAALRLAARKGPEAAIRAARPSHRGYLRLRTALARLREQADLPWRPLPKGPPIQIGTEEGPEVAALRMRLIELGDRSVQPSGAFDAHLDAAVRRVQTRFGLAVDGVVGPDTREALNATPADHARLVVLNMERWRWLPAHLGARHVWIDAAGMTTSLVEDGEAVWTRRTIVGTRRTPTPGFSSTITDVVLSPYWNIPESIARAEVRPRIARDPSYLARHHMERLPGGALRQRPGPDNPLGPVKFIFETPFGVRLHGTSAPSLYEQRVRTFSHGCIRVEAPLELSDRLLDEWTPVQLNAAVAAQKETWVALDEPLPIHATYWTARVDAGGTLHVRPDVYGRDSALARRLGLSPARGS